MLPTSFRLVRPATVVSFVLSLLVSLTAVPGVAQTLNEAKPVPSRLTQKIDERQLVPLTGTVHRLATAANDRGVADAGLPLERMQVVLKRSDAQETALKQLIADLHTAGSASYHQWLTPEQFGKQFGPSEEDVATLTAWLGSHGFTVTKLNPGRQTLEFTGTAGQFQAAFHAQIHKYQVNGETHYANASDPQIPAALAPVFGGFASLNNFRFTSYLHKLGTARYDPATHKTTPSWTVGTNGVNFVLAPGDFAVQYDLNPLYNAGTKGAGTTIGIINEANVSIALVNQYRSLFGLSVNPPTVILDGNDPGIDGLNNPDGPNYASGEAYLDVELAGAVAPEATVDLIIAADTQLYTGLTLAAEHAVYENVAPVLSLSFGQCEANDGAGGNAFWYGLWEQAAAQGQTVMVSSGDAGSAACDDDNTQAYAVHGAAVSGLASTPYNVAVGGTDFYYSSYNGTNAQITTQLDQYWANSGGGFTASNQTPTVSILGVIPEQPWNDSQYGSNLFNELTVEGTTSIAGGSGGASSCATGSGSSCAGYPKPAWQTGTGVPADGVRDLPDVSLFAANGFNYSYYPVCSADGDCQPVTSGEVQISGVGGTSASSPAFAGMMALVNQKYGRQGQANFVLYPLAKQYPAAFHDVTNGTNTVPCDYSAGTANCIAVTNAPTVTDPTYGSATEGEIGKGTTAEWNAGMGYDLASGLGTIDANVLVADWGKVTFTGTTTTLTPSKTSFAHGTAITVSGGVTPTAATGTVALQTDTNVNLNDANTLFTLANGAFSGSVNYLPGGTYNVFGSYSGDATHAPSVSAKTQITVTPEASKTTLVGLNEENNSLSGSISYGSQLLLTATPGAASGASDGSATGSVTFNDGTTTLDVAPVNQDGAAVFNAAPLVGSHSFTAAYSGDNSFNASTSSALAITVTKNTPLINYVYTGTQSSSTITAAAGTTTMTVTLLNSANTNFSYPAASPVIAPTGTMTLTGLPGGTLTFPMLTSAVEPNGGYTEGVTTVGIPAETAGTYTVTLSYPGDSNYAATSASFSVTITAATGTKSTTTATASPTATTTKTTVALTATVTGASGKAAPSGSVYLLFGGYEVGPLALTTTSGSDVSTVTTGIDSSTLIVGVNVITVQYAGDMTYAPSYATVTVTNGATANFTLAGNAPISVAQGSTGTSMVSVTPVGGFTGAVALGCVVTPMTAVTPTCSISGSASVTGVSPVTTALTVNTTSTTTAGTYVATVTGTSGALVTTTSVPVVVTAVTTTPSFALTNGGAITVVAGSGGSQSITVTPSGGFTGNVALSCAVTPTTGTSVPGCTVTSPVSITGTAAGSSSVAITTTSTTTAGAYTVTVTGVNGSITKTTAVTLTVTAAPVPAIALTNGGGITVVAGNSGMQSITVTPSGGFTGSVALSCAVTPTTGTSVPTCTVTSPVTISGTTAGTSTVTVNTTSTTTAGPYTVTVTGTGSGVTAATTAVALTVTAAPVPTIALTNAGPITVVAGNGGMSGITVTPGGGFTGSVALSCAVTPTTGTSVPTCSVSPSSVTISGTTAGTSTVSITTTGTTTAGTYAVTVTGTATGVTAATTSVVLTVTAAPVPAIALSNSGAITIAAVGGSGSSTITVTASGGFTGNVALTCAVTPTTGTSVPTCAVSPATVATSGSSTLTVTSTSSTTSGAYTVTVTGTATGVTTATTAVALTISAPVPTIALTATPAAVTVAPGSTGTSAIDVVTTGALAATDVSLTCAVTPTNETDTPTCSVTTVSSAGAATLTMGTTAKAENERPQLKLLPIGGGIAMAALLFFVVPVRRRRLPTLLGMVVLMALVGFSSGCGSGKKANPGTTPDTYQVTVTGTGSGATAATTTVTLTVN